MKLNAYKLSDFPIKKSKTGFGMYCALMLFAFAGMMAQHIYAQPTGTASTASTRFSGSNNNGYIATWSGSFGNFNGAMSPVDFTAVGPNGTVYINATGYINDNSATSGNHAVNAITTGTGGDITVFFSGTIVDTSVNAAGIAAWTGGAANGSRNVYVETAAGSSITSARGMAVHSNSSYGSITVVNRANITANSTGAAGNALDIRSTDGSVNQPGSAPIAIFNSGNITQNSAFDIIHAGSFGDIYVGYLASGAFTTTGSNFIPTGVYTVAPVTGTLSSTKNGVNGIVAIVDNTASNNIYINSAATINTSGANSNGIIVDLSVGGDNRANVNIVNAAGGNVTTTGNNSNAMEFVTGNRGSSTVSATNAGNLTATNANTQAVNFQLAQNGTNNVTFTNSGNITGGANSAAVQITGTYTATIHGSNKAAITNTGTLTGGRAIIVDGDVLKSGTINNTGALISSAGATGTAVALYSGSIAVNLGNGSTINHVWRDARHDMRDACAVSDITCAPRASSLNT